MNENLQQLFNLSNDDGYSILHHYTYSEQAFDGILLRWQLWIFDEITIELCMRIINFN